MATAGATFFRSIGGCFGVAICGAIFSNRLADELSRIAELRDRGYVEGPADAAALTAAGHDVLDRLVAARRERLGELLEGWSPETEAELAALLSRMARDVVADHPQAAPRGAQDAVAA